MLSAKDIREVAFSKSMGGYKQEEVDNLLDAIEEDYIQFDNHINAMNEKIEALNAEIETYKNSQASLQNILIEAQKLADKTVEDAKEKATLIINEAKMAADAAASEAKNMLDTFDMKFAEKKANAEREFAEQISDAERRKEAVENATADAVKRQQALFDKTRIEIANFKSEITELYKKHLEFIAKMPDCVAMDAKRAAEAITLMVNATPDLNAFLPKTEEPFDELEIAEPVKTIDEKAEGFVFDEALIEEEPELLAEDSNEDAASGFANGFFRRKK